MANAHFLPEGSNEEGECVWHFLSINRKLKDQGFVTRIYKTSMIFYQEDKVAK